MIIYTRDLDYKQVDALVKYPERLVTYVKSLVPAWAECFPGIVNNQRFYAATQIRTMLSIQYKIRKAAVTALCQDVALNGLTTECITVQEIFNSCNIESLRALVRNYYEQRNPQ